MQQFILFLLKAKGEQLRSKTKCSLAVLTVNFTVS